MRTSLLAGLLAVLPLAGALAQAARPLPTDPAHYSFDAGTNGCRATHLRTAAAQLARRVTTNSRSHEVLMNRYDMTFVRLDLGLELDTNSIGAGSNALILARNVSATVPLDTVGLELNNGLILDSVLVSGQRVPGSRTEWLPDGILRIRPVQPVAGGAAFSCQIWYHGIPGPTGGSFFGAGLTTENDQTWGSRVTWTLSSPFATSDWWPSKQVLSDKLDSSEVHVTTAATNKAGSNGVLKRTVTLPNGKVRYEWKSRYPIDYYLVSATVSDYIDYTVYAHPANMPNGDSIPVVNYVYPPSFATLQPEMDIVPPMIENYSEKYGLYPFWREKYGHCLAPIGGGMEHQTMTTLITTSPGLTSHELMHQWFGDNVTCRSYRDIWLNEGFATYGELVTIETFAPTYRMQWLQGNRSSVFQSLFGSVVVPAADTLNVGRIFDGRLTYAKGGLVIHMLRHLVNNDSAFFAALRNYQQQFGGRTAITADLQQSLETSLGSPLQWFFDQWIYGEGFPRTSIRWNQVGSDLLIESTQTPTAPVSVPFFRLPLEFDYTVTGQPNTTVQVEQTQATQLWTIPLPTGVTVATLQADPRMWTLTQVTRTRRDRTLGTTGLPADAATSAMTVYPNPCTTFLTLPATPGARTAEVLDLTGRVVSRQTLAATADHLPTTSLAAGTYLLRLTEGSGAVRVARFSRQ